MSLEPSKQGCVLARTISPIPRIGALHHAPYPLHSPRDPRSQRAGGALAGPIGATARKRQGALRSHRTSGHGRRPPRRVRMRPPPPGAGARPAAGARPGWRTPLAAPEAPASDLPGREQPAGRASDPPRCGLKDSDPTSKRRVGNLPTILPHADRSLPPRPTHLPAARCNGRRNGGQTAHPTTPRLVVGDLPTIHLAAAV